MHPFKFILTLSGALMLAACAPVSALPTPTALPAPRAATETPRPTETPAPAPTEAPTAEPARADPTAQPTIAPTEAPPLLSGVFVPQEVLPTGSYTLDPETGVLRFSDDFKVSTGPDLYVVLSGASDVNLEYHAFSQQVLAAPKLDLAKLKSPSGAQAYTLPAGTDLSQYRSVVVWCQTYSVAFIAAPLAP
jgi:hypothetical protein